MLTVNYFSEDKPWLSSSTNMDEKVFTFVDAPHLSKLIRNHYLDSGLIFNTFLSPHTISDLLELTSTTDMSIIYKLSEKHNSVKGTCNFEDFD